MPIVRSIAVVVALFFTVGGLSGGSCTVAVCKEDCDPCIQQCKCSTCQHGLAYDFGTVHRLTTFQLTEALDEEHEGDRSYSAIVGLSLDLAHGPREHSPAEIVRFARDVIEVNAGLLAPAGERWTPGPLEVFETSLVVPFRDERAGAALDVLFDRHANLIEIHRTRDTAR